MTTNMWSEIIKYYSGSDELKSYFTSDEASGFEDIDDMMLDEIAKVFAYQGFDPMKIVKILYKKHTDAMKTIATEIVVPYIDSGVNKAFKWTSHNSFKSDIHILLSLFALRGSSWEKVKSKSLGGMDALLEAIVFKYEIDTDVRSSLTTVGAEVVTLPRIAGCFPTIFCNLYMTRRAKYMFSPEEIGFGDEYPGAIMTPFCCSLIPEEWIEGAEGIMNLFFLVHIVTDNVIHRKSGDVTPLDNILSYFKATFSSPASPARGRKQACITLGLANAGGTGFSDVIKTAALRSLDILKELRGKDQNYNRIIADLAGLKKIGS